MKTLERDADVIVSGTCGIRELKETEDGKNNDSYAEYIRNFSIEKVYKNKNDLIKDKEIIIGETEHLKPDLASKEEDIFFKDGYVSMLENRQYTLFLTYSEKDDVFTVLEL